LINLLISLVVRIIFCSVFSFSASKGVIVFLSRSIHKFGILDKSGRFEVEAAGIDVGLGWLWRLTGQVMTILMGFGLKFE
jgi:hypothetical protein